MKVGNYEFALKGIKHFEAGSHETECFAADLYVNGKKVAECNNQGQGGPTDVNFYPDSVKLGREIEEFLKTQPKIKSKEYDFEYDLDLEYIVNDLLEQHLQEKFFKKLRKKTEKNIVFKASDTSYPMIGWTKRTIADMLKTPQGRDAIKKSIAEGLAKGYTLFNENIPAELIPEKK